MVRLMGTRNRHISNVISTNIVMLYTLHLVWSTWNDHSKLERTLSTDQEASVNTTRSQASHECHNRDLRFNKMGIWSTGRISEGKMIRPVASSDCAALADIYNHYILNTSITFEANTKIGQNGPKCTKTTKNVIHHQAAVQIKIHLMTWLWIVSRFFLDIFGKMQEIHLICSVLSRHEVESRSRDI